MTDVASFENNIIVREAAEADAELIVHFVRELAKFEKEPVETVRLTATEVLRDAFGLSPKFEVLIAEFKATPVGMALFFENYSTWTARPGLWIEELFVEEQYRRHGIGRRLLSEVARLARERSYGRVELSALKWNPAIAFYRRLGFEPMDDWQTYRVDSTGIDDFASM